MPKTIGKDDSKKENSEENNKKPNNIPHLTTTKKTPFYLSYKNKFHRKKTNIVNLDLENSTL